MSPSRSGFGASGCFFVSCLGVEGFWSFWGMEFRRSGFGVYGLDQGVAV